MPKPGEVAPFFGSEGIRKFGGFFGDFPKVLLERFPLGGVAGVIGVGVGVGGHGVGSRAAERGLDGFAVGRLNRGRIAQGVGQWWGEGRDFS